MDLLPCVEVSPRTKAKYAVIWLHGLGADGHDFEPIVPQLGLPHELGVRFVFPHAPAIPVSINAGMVMPAWYDILAAKVTQTVLLDLRTRVFRHTQRLSLEFHETYTSGRIISRQTSDLDTIRELLNGGLTQLVNGVLYGAFTLIALMLLDWRSGVVVVVAFVPLAFLMRWFYRARQRAYRGTRIISAQVIVKFVETMTGIRAGKAFRTEPGNEKTFGKLYSRFPEFRKKIEERIAGYSSKKTARLPLDFTQEILPANAQPTEQVRAILKLTGDWGQHKGDKDAVSTVKTREAKSEFEVDAAKKSVIKPKAEKKAEEPVAAPADEATDAADEAAESAE